MPRNSTFWNGFAQFEPPPLNGFSTKLPASSRSCWLKNDGV
jgi:hypothetical protein